MVTSIRRRRLAPLALILPLVIGGAAAAQAPAGAPPAAPAMPTSIGHTLNLAVELGAPATQGKLTVASPSFRDGQDIPWENTAYRGNIFPGLTWTKGPAATKSYVVFVQSKLRAGTSVHLTLFDVPATATSLPAGLKDAPRGASYGPNVHGANEAYSGPHAHGATRQQYFYQVLALDTVLQPKPGASLESLEAAMKGHVLASGAVVGISYQDPQAAPGA